MKNCVVGTGGNMIQADSFKSSLFVQSYKRIWEEDEKGQLDMGFNCTVEVKTSREVKVRVLKCKLHFIDTPLPL